MVGIRQATVGDIEALIALDTAAADDPARAAHIRDWVEAGQCHLAEEGGEPVGYAVLTHNFFRNGMVEMLMVGERSRRQGHGEALLHHLTGLCRTDKLWTSTNLSNEPMRTLLTKMGFRLSGFIENLDENDPELVFFLTVR